MDFYSFRATDSLITVPMLWSAQLSHRHWIPSEQFNITRYTNGGYKRSRLFFYYPADLGLRPDKGRTPDPHIFMTLSEGENPRLTKMDRNHMREASHEILIAGNQAMA